MNVILLENISKLGKLGEKVSVRAGFGRNFLIPQGKAVYATVENVAEFEARLSVRQRAEASFVLWMTTRDREHLSRAKRLLDDLVAHAPAELRQAMLANVPLHRGIAADAASAGL